MLLRVIHREVYCDGGQRGQVLVDRSQARAHRVDRHVSGAGSGPLGEFVGDLPWVTEPGDAAFHPDRRTGSGARPAPVTR